MRLTITTSFAILVAASAAFAQDEGARRAELEIATRVPFEKATTGAPYSAETLVEGLQTLADGNRIVRKTTGRVYRDGEGRTRREQDGVVRSISTPTNGAVTVSARPSISIVDPVEGFSYSLDSDRKIAWRTPIGTSAAIMGKVAAATEADRKKVEMAATADKLKRAAAEGDPTTVEEIKRTIEERNQAVAAAGARGGGGRGGALSPATAEVRMRGNDTAYAIAAAAGPLERKTLEGVPVEGRKTTTVIPAGQVGNEQPLTIVSEEWRSPELNVLVMTRYSDPRTGESTYRLVNIVRAEPDRSLFMVPPDYEVRESGVRKMLEAKK